MMVATAPLALVSVYSSTCSPSLVLPQGSLVIFRVTAASLVVVVEEQPTVNIVANIASGNSRTGAIKLLLFSPDHNTRRARVSGRSAYRAGFGKWAPRSDSPPGSGAPTGRPLRGRRLCARRRRPILPT